MADPSQATEASGQDGNFTDAGPDNVNEDAAKLSSLPEKDELADADVVTPLAGDRASLSGGESSNLSTVTEPTSVSTDSTEDHSRQSEEILANIPTISTTSSVATPSSHQPQLQPHEHAPNSYFASQSAQPQSFRRSMRAANTSSPSSGSLHTLAEQDGQEETEGPVLTDSTATVKRSLSTRSRTSPQHPRRHSKSASMSQSVASLRRQVNSEHPIYPDQSFSSLSTQLPHPSRPLPATRSRSSNPAQNLLYNDISSMSKHHADKLNLPQFARTADNTPMSSPGLFTPQPIRPSSALETDPQRAGSPQLHHLQTPKETHAAEIEHDIYTGNKLINTYEVVKELGRGEQGKVKLGRDLESGMLVAIKIVPRFSKQRRRLGKLGLTGEPQDQTKKEVAILKKARHPNVVSLLEVIDDPSKNKVYLVLEFVDHGEIIWRRRGVPAVTKINNSRFELESKGLPLTLEPSEQDLWTVRHAAMKYDGLQRSRANVPHLVSAVSHWNLESDADEDAGMLERTYSHAPSVARSVVYSESGHPQRSISQDDYTASGSPQQGPGPHGYHDDIGYLHDRKYSIATAMSHMSSEYDADDREADEQRDFVPTLTLDEARRAFRDTLLGLEFLHAVGIIHRDIKPANLLVASDGSIKISDFGVSYLGRPLTEADVKKDAVPENQAESIDDERELARNVGTPGFWAPELVYEDASIWADGKIPKITAAIDLWALGITLYTMVYGRLPWYASETMGLHAAQCTTPVMCPRSRIVPVDSTNPTMVTHSNVPISPGKRLDYDLRFEAVPESVIELIQKLLIKHPAERMTISEAKSHRWVLEGLKDCSQFLEPPAVVQNDQTVIVPNEKEISVAVVKLTLVDNLGNNLNKAGKWVYNSLKGAVTGRKRGSSLATNASTSSESINNSPTGSTTSTIGKHDRGREPRRTSLRGDEVIPALHRSREATTEHPLAQSQTASPDNTEMPGYFASGTPVAAPRDSSTGNASTDMRPKLPDRAVSEVSTAGSIKTIRASQVNPPLVLDPVSVNEIMKSGPTPHQTRIEGLWEGSRRAQSPLAGKDVRHPNIARSRSVSRQSSGSESRSAPSLALSTEYARGSIETPEALRAIDQRLEQAQEVTSPRSTASQYHKPITSSDSAFLQAQEINHRRHILETKEESDQVTSSVPSDHETSSIDECPPSPDDLTFDAKQRSQEAVEPRSQFDLGDSAGAAGQPISTTASSMEDFGNSSVTQSTSHPSFIATSGASSPPEEIFLSAEYRDQYLKDSHHGSNAPDFMRTADTVTEHDRPKHSNSTTKPTHDHVHYPEDDGDDEQDSDEDDDDEPVMMMGGGSIRRV